MVNFNGQLFEQNQVQFNTENRAFKYGDALFETIKYAYGKLLFWEDHYFRLMSSMRILRMDIPMNFSPEFLEEQILELINAQHADHDANRIRLTVYREGAGLYSPETNDISFLISTEKLPNSDFELNEEGLKVDLFKDHYKQKGLLSNLKSANSMLFVLASIFKKENRLDECILINDNKEVAEAISSNIFLVKDDVIYTPPLETGCLKGVMRKNVITLAKKLGFEIREEAFSPFELQRADEVFLTNAIKGLQWVGSYRKKEFKNEKARLISDALNESLQN